MFCLLTGISLYYITSLFRVILLTHVENYRIYKAHLIKSKLNKNTVLKNLLIGKSLPIFTKLRFLSVYIIYLLKNP